MRATTAVRNVTLALVGLALLAPVASSADTPYAGTYSGFTSGGRLISFQVGPLGRIDMYVELYKRCGSGTVIFSPTQTTPTDHFRVHRDGSFRIRGSFFISLGLYTPGLRAHAGLAHFSMRGWFARGRVVGWVTETDVLFNRRHKVIDRCTPLRLNSFRARR